MGRFAAENATSGRSLAPLKHMNGGLTRGTKRPVDGAMSAQQPYARQLEDLRVPPANRLEALKGDRKGQYSIRINQQWRICFVWKQNNAHNVEIVDYH